MFLSLLSILGGSGASFVLDGSDITAFVGGAVIGAIIVAIVVAIVVFLRMRHNRQTSASTQDRETIVDGR